MDERVPISSKILNVALPREADYSGSHLILDVAVNCKKLGLGLLFNTYTPRPRSGLIGLSLAKLGLSSTRCLTNGTNAAKARRNAARRSPRYPLVAWVQAYITLNCVD